VSHALGATSDLTLQTAQNLVQQTNETVNATGVNSRVGVGLQSGNGSVLVRNGGHLLHGLWEEDDSNDKFKS
jgi:predicted sugar kinase